MNAESLENKSLACCLNCNDVSLSLISKADGSSM